MNKKMRELLAKIQEKQMQAKAFMADGENKDVAKAMTLLDEADELQKEFEVEKRLYEAEKAAGQPTDGQVEDAQKAVKKDDAVKKFVNAARQGFPKATMTEGTQADGGYVVPEDIRTQIEHYRDSKFSLRSLVGVENVTTNKGSRTFKKRAQQNGFSEVAEGGKITATATPQFERMSYAIKKYAGYLPVTNELLADTDQNIVNEIVAWLGDEARVTDNKNILVVAKTFTAKTINKATALDDIKQILNVFQYILCYC